MLTKRPNDGAKQPRQKIPRTLHRLAPGGTGVFGFLKSAACVLYGLGTWTLGLPLVGATIASLFMKGSLWFTALGCFLIALPYVGIGPSQAWHQFMIHTMTTKGVFQETTFEECCGENCDEGVNFDNGAILLCYHPHGIFCGAFSGSHGVLHPELVKRGVRFLLTDALYHMPLFRFFVVHLFGHIRPAGKATMELCMRQGENLAILPGGFEEASLTKQGKERVYLSKRGGFIKLALRHGYTLHPTYSFGENDCFLNLVPDTISHRLRFRLNALKIPVVAPIGRWWCPLLPLSGSRLHTVVGRAVHCPKTSEEDITAKLVTEYQRKYARELLQVFEDNKRKYGFGDRSLEIF